MSRCPQTWLSLARYAAQSTKICHSHSITHHGRGLRTSSACLSTSAFDAIRAPKDRSALLAFHSDHQVGFGQAYSCDDSRRVSLEGQSTGLHSMEKINSSFEQEVDMPEKHRFPMRKYRLTREALQADASVRNLIEVREV